MGRDAGRPRGARHAGFRLAALGAAAFFANGAVAAAAETVDSLTDDGTGTTLRDAVQAANANADTTEITFAPALTAPAGVQTIVLGSQLPITSPITIAGPGAGELAVSGGDTSRIFYLEAGSNLTISDLLLTEGEAADVGGAIRSDDAALELSRVVVSDNAAVGAGGGIYASNSQVTIADSIISGNSGDSGGGIGFNDNVNRPAKTIMRTRIYGNSARAFGGGISASAPLVITRSEISGNSALQGGGLAQRQQAATVRSSTIAGNTVAHAEFNTRGGGIYIAANTLTVENSTVASNTASGPNPSGGGIAVGGGSLGTNEAAAVVKSSIVADSTPADVEVSDPAPDGAVSIDHSLIEDAAAGAIGTDTESVLAVDPLLGPLAPNGGTTRTMALDPASPALDGGLAPIGDATDQRGLPIVDLAEIDNAPGNAGGADMGAYELQAIPDVTPPALTVGVKRKQKAGSSVKAIVGCDEDCAVVATGKLVTTVRKRGGGKRKRTLAIKGRSASLVDGEVRLLTIPLGGKAARAAKRALRAGGGAKVALKMVATDDADNSSSKRSRVTLR